MIGNDIVDLDDEEARSFHPRFDERVFAATELDALRESSDLHRLRWLLWAAKESAYKLLRRTLPDLIFSPSRFVARPAGPRTATIDAFGHAVRVRYKCGPAFVHCVAGYLGADATLVEVAQLSGTSTEQGASEAVRRLALRSIACHLAIDERRLRVDRTGRMPVVVHGSRPLPGTLSLSHHGRFVAFAWQSGSVRRLAEAMPEMQVSGAKIVGAMR